MRRIVKNTLMVLLLIIIISLNFYLINNLECKLMNHFNNEREFFNPQTDDMKEEQPPQKPESEGLSYLNFEKKGHNDVLIVLNSAMISLISLYLIMSKFNKYSFKETFKNVDKIVIFILALIILTTIMYCLLNNNFRIIPKDNNEKETSGTEIESGQNVLKNIINLNDYTGNITLTEAKEYTITGEFDHSLLINANGKVTINLENVTINSQKTAAIANISKNELIINIVDNTSSFLSDGGSSEYDGCIYSSGPLTFIGNGNLTINGRQEDGEGIATTDNNITINGGNIVINSADDGLNAGGDAGGIITVNGGNLYIQASGDGIDSNNSLIINGGFIYVIGSSLGGDAGIDTDKGFTINGGTVIALGSDMLETPLKSSKQNTISFTLNSKIESGTLITLLNAKDEVIVSFEATDNFKTLIISSALLKNDIYTLYRDGSNKGVKINNVYMNSDYLKGEIITINNQGSFTLTSNVTTINTR